jgi:hypothetical protein
MPTEHVCVKHIMSALHAEWCVLASGNTGVYCKGFGEPAIGSTLFSRNVDTTGQNEIQQYTTKLTLASLLYFVVV